MIVPNNGIDIDKEEAPVGPSEVSRGPEAAEEGDLARIPPPGETPGPSPQS